MRFGLLSVFSPRRWLSWAVVAFVAVTSGFAASAGPAVAFKQIRVGAAVVSLPSDWTTRGEVVPLWLHLHGAPAVVENNFASFGAPGVVVNVTLPGLSKMYADHFADPAVFTDLLRAAESVLRAESPAQAWRVGAVTVSSFSAGFGGVRELLKQPAAVERIAALVMADSIYCGYVGDAAEKRIDPELMAGFVQFARLAADGRKRLVVSHSAQVPPGYASTTETADFLIRALNGARTFEPQDWTATWRQVSQFSQGNVEILGFDGATADDHMQHLRGIGRLLERVAPTAPASGAKTLAALHAQLEAHVGAPRFAGALWGIKVVSLESGRTLYENEPRRLQSPASNSKLYAGALALHRLGGDYRIVTPLFATAAPDANGMVAGDVIVSGRGDPSWNSSPKREAFSAVFTPLAEALARAGVKRIEGDLIADASWFRMAPNGAGWTADDLNDYYGAEVSALSLEDNYADVRIVPGSAVGQPAGVALLQPATGLTVENRATTIAKGGTRRIEVRRFFDETIVRIFGEVPLEAAPLVESITVPRPAAWFAAAAHAELGRRGIAIAGKPRSVRWPEVGPVLGSAVRLGEIASPPLRELVRAFMKPSQNLQTDLIFAHVGESSRTPTTPAWRTSEQLAVTALQDFLRQHALEAQDVRFEEGSGLSRNNLTSAAAVVALLKFMAARPDAGDFVDSLPIAGVDGSLRRRMKGTAAEGNVRAKTGTLRWANSLSGYVTTAAGERLAFSVLLNRSVTPVGRNARDDVDAIAVMLAQFAGRAEP